MSKEKINIGIIGIGRWGSKLADIFSEEATVAAFVSKSSSHIDTFQKKHPHAVHYATIENLLSDERIEALVIATPIETHYEIALQCLKHKKHVFIEKPIALKTTQVTELLEKSKENNVVLFSGYTFLYDPAYVALKGLIKNTPLDEILFSWNKFGSFKEPGTHNLLCHDIALAVDLVGTLNNQQLLSSSNIIGREDIISAQATSSVGRISFYINRFSLLSEKRIIIKTPHTVYTVSNGIVSSFHSPDTKTIEFSQPDAPSPLLLECRDFLEKVSEKTYWTRADGLHDLEVARFFEKIHS